jgi:hypothetical protein
LRQNIVWLNATLTRNLRDEERQRRAINLVTRRQWESFYHLVVYGLLIGWKFFLASRSNFGDVDWPIISRCKKQNESGFVTSRGRNSNSGGLGEVSFNQPFDLCRVYAVPLDLDQQARPAV